MVPINYLAVVVAAIVAFIIGFLMHGPVAGKLWMRLANVTPTGNEKFADMIPQMLWNLLVNVVTAGALAMIIGYASDSTFLVMNSAMYNALLISFIVWAGFIAASSSIGVIWMGQSFKLWAFEAFSSLLVMLAMGATVVLM